MAPVKISYEELSWHVHCLGASALWSPFGQDDEHHACISRHDNQKFLVTGSKSGQALVGPNDVVFYDEGHVLKPEDARGYFADPIEKLLVSKGLSLNFLRSSTENDLFWKEDIAISREGHGVDYWVGYLRPVVLGKAVSRKRKTTRYVSKSGRLHIVYWHKATGGDALLLFRIQTWPDPESGRKLQWKKLVVIFVRPGVDHQRVADWLRNHLRFIPDHTPKDLTD